MGKQVRNARSSLTSFEGIGIADMNGTVVASTDASLFGSDQSSPTPGSTRPGAKHTPITSFSISTAG
jgi:hypothetical protein